MSQSAGATLERELSTTSSSFAPGHRRQNEVAQRREVRFPSSQLNSESFVRIDSWQQDREPRSSAAKAVGSWCEWFWCGWRNWPRRRQMILVSCVILLLFLVAASTILLILLLVKDGGGGNYHNNVPSSQMSTTTTSPPTTPSPFLAAFVIQTQSAFHDVGANLSSLVPDRLAFIYRDRLLGYSVDNDTIFIYSNGTFDGFNVASPTQNVTLDTLNCANCDVLSIDDSCVDLDAKSWNCTSANLIYCCTGCQGLASGGSRCWVKGILFETSDAVVEREVTADRNSLFLCTYGNNSQPCTLQSYLIDSVARLTKASPVRPCPVAANGTIVQLATVSLNYLTDFELLDQHIVAFDELGVQYIFGGNRNETSVQYGSGVAGGDPRQLLATVVGRHLLSVTLLPDVFLVTRQSVGSDCITVLAGGGQKFSYDGQLRGADWIDNQLYLWLTDRQGVNLVVYTFQWPDDIVCPAQQEKGSGPNPLLVDFESNPATSEVT